MNDEIAADIHEALHEADGTPMDLAYLRDLLSLLSEFRVKGFTLGNLAVAFGQDELDPPQVGRTVEQIVLDEGRSTSSRQVKGFDGQNIWKHPALWQTQGGKPLKFDGSTLE